MKLQQIGTSWAGRLAVVGGALLALGVTQPVHAAPDTKSATLNINANFSPKAKLTLDSSLITFDGTVGDPDSNPLLSGGTVAFTTKVRLTTGSSATLTADSTNLTSGSDTIDVNNVQWTVAGGGSLVDGSFDSANSAQPVGSWTMADTSNGQNDIDISYTMTNKWEYPVGNYAGSIVYTLTAN